MSRRQKTFVLYMYDIVVIIIVIMVPFYRYPEKNRQVVAITMITIALSWFHLPTAPFYCYTGLNVSASSNDNNRIAR